MDDDVESMIQNAKWYRSFEIFPDVWTPGNVKMFHKAQLDEAKTPKVLSGKRFLDIGAWDGIYTFELESRGAEVVAIDIQDPDSTAFNIHKRIKNGRASYIRTDVYEMNTCDLGLFDGVLFFGVFYHLQNPMKALENIRRVLKPNGVLYIEGEGMDSSFNRDPRMQPHQELITQIVNSGLPLTLFVSGEYLKDASNWFIPTTSCMREWLSAAGFKDIDIRTKPSSRIIGSAIADPDFKEWEFRLSSANKEAVVVNPRFSRENRG